jgi:hypothetical protein
MMVILRVNVTITLAVLPPSKPSTVAIATSFTGAFDIPIKAS